MTDAELLAALERERYGDPTALALEAWPHRRRRPRIATVHQLVPAAAAATPAPAWVRSA